MAARCGGLVAAMDHCAEVRYETPDMPTFPLLHGWAAAHSMKSWPHAASSGDRKVALPPECQDPGMSVLTTA
jgi:hypothetical protein